jgi:hypothetical protein
MTAKNARLFSEGKYMDIQDYVLVALVTLLGIWAFYVRDRCVPEDILKRSEPIVLPSPHATQPQNPGLPRTLAEAMLASIDVNIPAQLVGAPAIATDSDPQESLALAKAVTERVTSRAAPGTVNLSVTNVDSVAKTSDAYKTVFYELMFNAYEAVTNVGVKLFATLIIPASKTGTMYIHTLRTADLGLSGPADAGDGLCLGVPHAPWEPSIKLFSEGT